MAAHLEVDRFKAFTDAVVAIALTLLVFPLLEGVPSIVQQRRSVATWAADNVGSLAFFALSFMLISTFWRTHEHLFRHVREVPRSLAAATTLWMFTIVVMPVTTALLSAPMDAAQVVCYIGTMVACAATLTLQAWLVGRGPAATLPVRTFASSLVTTGLMLLALILALATLPLLAPAQGGLVYFWLMLASLTGVIGRRIQPLAARLLGRPEAAR